MKKILITGPTGFLGANLYHYLLQKQTMHQIFLAGTFSDNWRLSTQEISQAADIFTIDIANFSQLKRTIDKIRPNIVYNIAAYGVNGDTKNWPKIIKTNVVGTTNLFQALAKNPPEHVFQIGTCFEYGSTKKTAKETTCLNPKTIYSASKISSTYLALTIGKTLSIPTTVIRPYSLYGPYDNPFRLVAWTILTLLKNESTVTLTPGKKDQIKDFLYVEDLSRLLYEYIEHQPKPYQIFNVSNPQPISVEDIIKLIAKLMKSNAIIKTVNPQDMPFTTIKTEYPVIASQINKITNQTHWQPTYNLEKGLTKTINWFKKKQSLYKE